ncbi:hypothetical protein PILCRDRAFT_436143 [Piloderma croceum F 1598]|uniref:Uncharacterized protein n=1 Tax=Piloderma croceum (strain F 1598) TaxID=765440 RepID=A0A0C3BAB1_PILCF|nr:hypothetical protein PILCRDRAFT_436143 [Piloderma croceum F 1598]
MRYLFWTSNTDISGSHFLPPLYLPLFNALIRASSRLDLINKFLRGFLCLRDRRGCGGSVDGVHATMGVSGNPISQRGSFVQPQVLDDGQLNAGGTNADCLPAQDCGNRRNHRYR